MAHGNLKEHSKGEWSHAATMEAIQVGCLQRIADATEKMASSYSAIIDERDRYKRFYYDEKRDREHAERRVSAYRGKLTRAKKEIARLRAMVHG